MLPTHSPRLGNPGKRPAPLPPDLLLLSEVMSRRYRSRFDLPRHPRVRLSRQTTALRPGPRPAGAALALLCLGGRGVPAEVGTNLNSAFPPLRRSDRQICHRALRSVAVHRSCLIPAPKTCQPFPVPFGSRRPLMALLPVVPDSRTGFPPRFLRHHCLLGSGPSKRSRCSSAAPPRPSLSVRVEQA